MFSSIVKPDFQRATCAWTPENCVTFLNSVIRGRIIPSIILWRSSETGLLYVLDGAHRLSVLRAWMHDDWGDKGGDFYQDDENRPSIIKAAHMTRDAVNNSIGPFADFMTAHKELMDITFKGGAAMLELSSEKADKARFYSDAIQSSRTLHAQWEDGDYSAAEESFLAINRHGVRLDQLESLLIEHRNGSMARVIMSIANAGAPGHYWPDLPVSDSIQDVIRQKLASFNGRCRQLHQTLFVPPFDTRVTDVNVPFLVSPGHFRKQQHLIEFLPLLSEGSPVSEERYPELLGKDRFADACDLVLNADELLTVLETKLEHLGGASTASLSLALVPLIYWYSRKGAFGRGLVYGWANWLLSGSKSEVQERKIAFSAVRGDLERALTRYKDEFSDVQHSVGGGFKSLSKLTKFIQELVTVLIESRAEDETARDGKVQQLFGFKPASTGKGGKGRGFTKATRAEINVRELLGSAVKCEICDGVIDLKQGVQYDHKHHAALGGSNKPDNGRPTHPFCNLFRERITDLRLGRASSCLPHFGAVPMGTKPFKQLMLFDDFPGEISKR
ncbi:GmrSD restriction endonuclease domain-containing protein [Massilia antarctica]|uniref:GmrSD restriction endonuclease domain-containing protein n=1 Tax=Massilia antarctica TaxID=2765360 RepID=UPI0015E1A346|nr:DUF262 domain-containing protein [Massilia sp. H27-R4]MCY0913818.1 DUF262 domain-containing protein [Massilia sp. H27-R4]